LALAAEQARGQLARAEAARREAFATARAWRSDLTADTLPALPPLPVPDPAFADPPVLLALRHELAAEHARRAQAAQWLEMPILSAGWQRQEALGKAATGATVGLAWTVPLFDRGQAARQSAEARVTATSARLELAERESEARRVGTLAAYRTLREAALGARHAATDGIAVTAAATAAFAAGETSVTDLLDAIRSATEAELAALELYGEALAAHRRLMEAAGAPSSEAPATNP
jgi:cobalt-zinc-cadmium efflux system outer membrane protein